MWISSLPIILCLTRGGRGLILWMCSHEVANRQRMGKGGKSARTWRNARINVGEWWRGWLQGCIGCDCVCVPADGGCLRRRLLLCLPSYHPPTTRDGGELCAWGFALSPQRAVPCLCGPHPPALVWKGARCYGTEERRGQGKQDEPCGRAVGGGGWRACC